VLQSIHHAGLTKCLQQAATVHIAAPQQAVSGTHGAFVGILAAGKLFISRVSHVRIAAWILSVPTACSAS